MNKTQTNLDFHLTRQRELIMDILKETPGHLDAGMIYLEAKKRDDRISLATVYRTLDLFTKAGLVAENNLGEDHGHFEAVQGPQHYHFTCLGCGKVVEFYAAGIPQIMQAIGNQQGLQVTEIHLNLRGYCSDCKKKTVRDQGEFAANFGEPTDLKQPSREKDAEIPLKTLSELSDGKAAVVSRLLGDKEIMNRIASMGFTIGAYVKVIHNENHNPMIVSIMDTHLALGRKEADLIQVQPL